MDELNQHSANQAGCLMTAMCFCAILSLAIICSESDAYMLLAILICIGGYAFYEYRKITKVVKNAENASTDAMALMLELNKDFLQWKDAQRLSFSENIPGNAIILQTSRSAEKLAILRLNGVTQSADLRVYDFSELKSWKTRVEKTSTQPLLFGLLGLFSMPAISHISVEFTFFYKKKIIEQKIVLFDSNTINEQGANAQLKKLAAIKDFLTYIQPESR